MKWNTQQMPFDRFIVASGKALEHATPNTTEPCPLRVFESAALMNADDIPRATAELIALMKDVRRMGTQPLGVRFNSERVNDIADDGGIFVESGRYPTLARCVDRVTLYQGKDIGNTCSVMVDYVR